MKRKLEKYGLALAYFSLIVLTVIFFKIKLPRYSSMLTLLVLFFVVDFFLWQEFKKVLYVWKSRSMKRLVVGAYYLPFLFLFIFILGLWFSDITQWSPFCRTYLLGGMIMLFITHVIIGFFYLLGGALQWIFRSNAIGRWIYRNLHVISIGAGAISFFILLYAMVVTTFDLRLEVVNLRHASATEMAESENSVPVGLKGYKILQISDLHIGSFTAENQLKNVVKMAMLTHPDLIVFTGDMVNFSSKEMKPYLSILSHLQAPDGIYCVMGNHDYGDYISWSDSSAKADNVTLLKKYYERIGWQCLDNSSVVLLRGADSLHIVGVENWGKGKRFPKRGDLKKALEPHSVRAYKKSRRLIDSDYRSEGTLDLPKETQQKHTFTVLLSHDPSHFDSVVYPNFPQVDLCLSGHTHAMQLGFRVGGKDYSPAVWLYKHFSGLYKMPNGQKLYVSTGCGFNGFPFRLGIRPSITLIEL